MFNVRTFLATPFVLVSWAADFIAFHAWYISCWIAGEEIGIEIDDEEDSA